MQTNRKTRVAMEWLYVMARLAGWGAMLVVLHLVVLVAMSGHACGDGVLP